MTQSAATRRAKASIAEPIRRLAAPVESLTLHPKNPRHGVVPKIAASLTRFGQVKPIVAQASTGHIVAGNHTYRAALSLDWPLIAVVRVEMTDEDAEAYMVADNRTSDVATNDDAALLAILETMSDTGQLAGTGFEPDDVEDLRAALDAIHETTPEDFQGGYSEPPEDALNRQRTPPEALKEVVMLLRPSEAEVFAKHMDALRAAWGISGVTQTVLRAAAECAKQL
jgi:hypothetical protein